MTGDVLDKFFAQAREVQFGDRDEISLTPDEIYQIVSNNAVRARFILRFAKEAQSEELRTLIRLYLQSIASKEEEIAAEMRIDADGVERYVGRVGIGGAGAGIVMIVSTGGTGAVILVGGGLVAMAASGYTSNRLRKRALKRETLAKRIRETLEEIADD